MKEFFRHRADAGRIDEAAASASLDLAYYLEFFWWTARS